ncbi:MAG: fimbrial assembly protein [Clostridiales bacterium]|nr:fimbrial assembly protein [Clostridiales bacterium]
MSEQQAAAVRKPEIAGNTDTSLLKLIALAFMIVDHIGVAFFPGVMEWRVFGRIAMPLYAWCLVVGSEYTRNALKYALRLLILGVVSQPFYIMALGNSWTDLNILFLLCLSVLVIAGIREKRWYSQFWAPALGVLILLFVHVDYGWKGLLFILLLYMSRKSKLGIAGALLAASAFWGMYSFPVTKVFGLQLSFLEGNFLSPILQLFFQMQALMWMALPLILVPMHSNIRIPKWMGYGLYPVHLIALIVVSLILGVPLSYIISSLATL